MIIIIGDGPPRDNRSITKTLQCCHNSPVTYYQVSSVAAYCQFSIPTPYYEFSSPATYYQVISQVAYYLVSSRATYYQVSSPASYYQLNSLTTYYQVIPMLYIFKHASGSMTTLWLLMGEVSCSIYIST